ncbi:MAG TPA: hypothetical protein VGX25_01680 [Actinophytocola sp.]|uniref:hypothetical protein n=1 Tax=Actinophytocola sp. TaxID=1872138 RepID=UPI002DDCAB65|nr:hypothetical protein [Actinophytocola sp.]HEV2778088.1 hypothetical protein [Actinophytocola sp.]
MTTLKTLDRRITSLEGDVKEIKEVQASHSESIYKMHRRLTKHDLRWTKLFEHFNIEDVTDAEVDEVLDAE